jgi:excisionase family DNA binding protein
LYAYFDALLSWHGRRRMKVVPRHRASYLLWGSTRQRTRHQACCLAGHGSRGLRHFNQLFPARSDSVAAPVPLVLTVEQAAERLGIGRTVMYALVSSGAVESVQIGRLRRVPADALVTFLDELRAGRRGGAV